MRERIIGAIAVVIVAIIVIPWLVAQVRAPREIERPAPVLAPLVSTVPDVAPYADQSLYNLPPLNPAKSAPRAAPTPATAPGAASSAASKADKSLYDLPPVNSVRRAPRASPTPATTPSVALSAASKADKSLYDLPPLNPAKRAPTASRASAESPTRGSVNPQPPAAGSVAAVPTAGWGVQAASFPDRKTAEALRAKLLQAGVSAFLSPHVVGGTTYYRVMAGPYPSAAAARAKVSSVAAVSRTKAVVRQLGDQGG